MQLLTRFRDLPIQRKLTVVMVLVSATGLIFAAAILIAYTSASVRAGARNDLETTARIVADATAAALVFNDVSSARDTLAALRAKPEVIAACLYRVRPGESAELLAVYAPGEPVTCAAGEHVSAGTVSESARLLVTVPVTLKDEHLGWLTMTLSLARQQEALTIQIGITLLAIAVSFAISLLLAWAVQRLISKPILDLAETARRISDTRDYSVRAPPSAGRDEVGQLIKDFNQMLEQIRQRDAEVREARDASAREAHERAVANKELQQALQELRDTQELVRATVKSAVDGIIVIDASGVVQAFNPAAESMFGYPANEVIGQNIRMLMPPPYAGEHDGYLRNYLTTGVRKIMGSGREVTGRCKDGSVFPMDLAVSEMKIGSERWFAGIVRDISMRRHQEGELRHLNDSLGQQVAETRTALQRLKEAQTQLVQSEKMASLGALVAGVAHEINTPVGVGVTAASTLQNSAAELKVRYETDSLRRSDLEHFVAIADESSSIILRNLQRASDLIHSFKQVAVDQSSGERRSLELKGYVEDVLASLGPKLRRSGHAVKVNAPEPLAILTYPGALAQILTNFVSNSILHAYAPGQPGTMTIDLLRDGDTVLLRYKDDGAGIPKENLSRIFDPFFTTKRGSGGSGLGMHIVYNLVTQVLGGTIDVHSTAGKGTEFVVRFPVQLSKAAA